MKNQYFGDVGDYGKYGLLRLLAKQNIKIAVNWYLTPDDDTKHGNHTNYLKNYYMGKYDKELFDLLKDMVLTKDRSILSFEERNAIPDAIYYHTPVDYSGKTKAERQESRKQWHANALSACESADLVYLDPDNGAHDAANITGKSSLKYCFPEEIADYYNRGQDVVYYCSNGRRTYEQWEGTKTMALKFLPNAKLLIVAYCKGAKRSYIFVLHEEHYQMYSNFIDKLVLQWPGIFCKDIGGVQKTGEHFHVIGNSGATLTLEEDDDGWVEVRITGKETKIYRTSIDDLIRNLKH